MDIVTIEAKTLPEAWFLCVKGCMEKGYIYTIDRGSHTGSQRREFDFIIIKVEYPGVRPLVPDTPEGIPPPTSMDYIEKYLPYMMVGTNVRKENEQYTYGEDVEPQLNKIIDDLKQFGFGSNQTCITIGDKNSVMLDDPQCVKIIDIRIRYGKVHFIVYVRSWDLWSGFPANLAAIQIMKEYTASMLGLDDGELIALSKGLHLYTHHWKYAEALIKR